MEDYNYLSSYGEYGTSSFIPKKTVEDITENAPTDMDTFKEVADKISEISGGGSSSDISELNEKIEKKADKDEVESKFAEIESALEEKADSSELENLATKEEVEQVKADVENILRDAPEELDTLKEIADLLETKQDASEVVSALSTKVNQTDFDSHVSENTEAFSAINETLATKANTQDIPDVSSFITMSDVEAMGYTTFDGSYNSLTDVPSIPTKVEDLEDASEYAKVAQIPTVPVKLSELENDADFVQDNAYVHTDNNYTSEEKEKLAGLTNYDDTELSGRVATIEGAGYINQTQLADSLEGYVKDENYVHTDNNYTTEEKNKLNSIESGANVNVNADWDASEGDAKILNKPTFATVATTGDYNDLDNKPSQYDDTALAARVTALENEPKVVDTRVSGLDVVEDDDDGKLLVITSTNGTDETETSVNVNKIFDHTQYFTKDETMNTFIDDSEANTMISAAVAPKADTTALESAVHELVVRLNKLEAQNKVLVEKGTDSADEINGMTSEEAANADIVVASNEAIAALSDGKTFNSVTIAGGEIGGDAVLNFSANESIDIDGLTISGTKGSGNGKIFYGANDVVIANVNIEPGCTAYNVFEGKQDKNSDNCIDNFTATDVIVNDVDLKHNVFNIYQVNDGANIIVKDSMFNLDVANSNVMRISNITNAENVTITFENVDWNYENKSYSASDAKWAGLLIYQPYGTDVAYNADYSKTQTWTINIKNCRYNGKHVTENSFGTIEQVIYQYNINGSNACEAPDAFGTINFE